MTEMKRTYVKPDFTMMHFNLSDNIATSSCTLSSTATYEEQDITCIIDGSETVFYSGTCDYNVTSGYLGTYNGQTYFVWYDGKVGTQPTSAQEQELTAIETAVGATAATGNPGWHAGVASSTISSIWNSSY